MICQLDGIAREGVSAQRHLSGPLCSPLRAGILTGPTITKLLRGPLLRSVHHELCGSDLLNHSDSGILLRSVVVAGFCGTARNIYAFAEWMEFGKSPILLL